MSTATHSSFRGGERKVAVLIPCYNEAAAIGKVVRDFRKALPLAEIYVYDNNSTDDTRERALEAGARVGSESRQGKGNVVRRMFNEIDADIYVMVDGDDTYDAFAAPALIDCLIRNACAMVVGRRVHQATEAYRPAHVFGNQLLSGMIGRLFGNIFTDVLSGYRVFTRQFVKSFPLLTGGFELETELTVHALGLRLPVREIDTVYGPRPTGSASKLATYRDGYRILLTILALLKNERPLLFFGSAFVILELLAMGLAYPIVVHFIETGLVPRFPTAILATGIGLLGFIALTCGLVLDTVSRGRWETKYLGWLHAGNLPHLRVEEPLNSTYESRR
jgi:glycosyltransferase involved in cell wall biosynthesis